MGRKRLDEDERRVFVGIRLPNWLVKLIKQDGTPQEIIEKDMTEKYSKLRKKE